MKIKGKSESRTISIGKDSTMEIEVSEIIIEQIKKEYGIESVDDYHLQIFFRDVLKDASLNILNDR